MNTMHGVAGRYTRGFFGLVLAVALGNAAAAQQAPDGTRIRLRLFVYDRDAGKSKPVTDQELRVWRSDTEQPRLARTDSAGELLIRAPAPNRRKDFWFALDATGYQLAAERFYGQLPEKPDEATSIELVPADPIEVTIVDSAGAPVQGAEVRTTAIGTDTYVRWDDVPPALEPLLSARTDGNGVARVRRGPGGQEIWAFVQRNGRALLGEAPWPGGAISSRQTAPRRAVLREATEVRLRFIDARTGAPLEGVLVMPLMRQPEYVQQLSDANGEVHYDQLAWIQQPRFYVRHPGHQFGTTHLVGPAGESGTIPAPDPVTRIEVPLSELQPVRGKVIDDRDGTPLIASVRIECTTSVPVQDDWRLDYDCRVHRVEPTATFELLAPPGPTTFRICSPHDASPARAAHAATIEQTLAPIPDEQTPAELTLRVVRQPGILFQNRSTDPSVREAFSRWSALKILVGPADGNTWSYASRGEFWFFPVDAWGDRLHVRAEWRGGPSTRVLIDRDFVARPADWPVALDLEIQKLDDQK